MKNKISILMHVNTLLSAVSLCVVLAIIIVGFGLPGSPIYFGISLTYISLNVLLSPIMYKIYKKKKTTNMIDFTGYISLFFSCLFLAITIYCIALFCSTFSFIYGVLPFFLSLFLLLISLILFSVALFITVSKYRELKKSKDIQNSNISIN